MLLENKHIMPIVPMEPVMHDAPFDSNDYLYQVKWDGVHVLAYISDDNIQLFNRKKNERTNQFPEIVYELNDIPSGTILDGEVICLNDEGKPDFFRVLKRDQTRNDSKINALTMTHPVHYMIFDMLYYKGESLISQPLSQRLKLLQENIQSSHTLQIVDSVMHNGIALFDTVDKEDMEGIVAKKIDSPYIMGTKSPLWKKIKAWREIDTIVGGWQERDGELRSLLVGIQQDEGLLYVGSVSSGLTFEQRKILKDYFLSTQDNNTFINPPSKSNYNYNWVEPTIGVKVRYLEWSNDNKLRSPSVIDLKEIKDIQ